MATENDIVLVYFEDQPLFFARIEEILPDAKKDWYHVKLLVLQVPVQTVTWILRDVYINGAEFTMGGKRMRMEKVEVPDEGEISDGEQEKEKPVQGEEKAPGTVISLDRFKPKK